MVETSDSWLREQQYSCDLSAFRTCMISPVEHRQYEFLPTFVNPRWSSTLCFNELGFSDFPERGFVSDANDLIGNSVSHSQTPVRTPNEYLVEQTSVFPAGVVAQASTYGTSIQQKKFLIFDQSRNETRLMFSPLCPQIWNPATEQATHFPWNQQTAPVSTFGACQLFSEGQPVQVEQAYIKAPIISEELGENETVDEGSEMQEDTEEINALLYSEEDDDFDTGEGEDDDEVSTGHYPSVNQETQKEYEFDFDEVDSSDISAKRQKTLDGGCNKPPLLCATTMGNQNISSENMHGGDLSCTLVNGVGDSTDTIRNKRPRKDKIRDTLRVLESIVPGVKSKDPLVILDEAINYLKSLKSNPETMSMEEPDSSSCYEPSN